MAGHSLSFPAGLVRKPRALSHPAALRELGNQIKLKEQNKEKSHWNQ
jgi:hypothetical protein